MTDPARVQPLHARLGSVPAGSWVACPRCRSAQSSARLRRTMRTCPLCGMHQRLTLAERIDTIADPGSFAELDAGLAPVDPLGFTDSKPYPQRLAAAAAKTGHPDAAVYGTATVGELPVVLCVLDFAFMGGSMGSVVGEKVSRAAELALARRVPLITCSSSGGARMQEGIFSLLQMAKTAAVLRRLADSRVPHVSVLADPVYGGVMASFATIADVIIAEPGARAGFAGPQVIEQTIRQTLPEGFQTAEFLARHGHIDAVVPRPELRSTLARIARFHAAAERGARLADAADEPVAGRQDPAGPVVAGADPETGTEPDAWQVVQRARHPRRPLADDYLTALFDSFVELGGDRCSGDDPAVVGGLARFGGAPVVVLAHRKGRGTTESIARNFGMPHPAGYRKSRRLMEYAERYGVPLVMLVDTPGAYPGLLAEQENQSGAISANLATLAGLRVPVVAAVLGEGGSGGALALGVCDRLLMLANATLSVISPEGCATILFGDAGQAPGAARALRLTAAELARDGIVDEVLPEPAGGAHEDPHGTYEVLRGALRRHLGELLERPVEVVLKERYRRLRAVGSLRDPAEQAEQAGLSPMEHGAEAGQW
jgi:acyl-CoA carboxylase subunit beta